MTSSLLVTVQSKSVPAYVGSIWQLDTGVQKPTKPLVQPLPIPNAPADLPPHMINKPAPVPVTASKPPRAQPSALPAKMARADSGPGNPPGYSQQTPATKGRKMPQDQQAHPGNAVHTPAGLPHLHCIAMHHLRRTCNQAHFAIVLASCQQMIELHAVYGRPLCFCISDQGPYTSSIASASSLNNSKQDQVQASYVQMH